MSRPFRGAAAAGLFAVLGLANLANLTNLGSLGDIAAAAPAFAPAAPSPSGVIATPALVAPPGGAALAPSPNASPSAAPPPTEDIRDIRGPKFVLPPWLIPVLVAAIALIAAAAYFAWRWLRRRRRARALLPFEEALQRLEAIRALLEPAHAREFSIAVSDIVRRYIEQRFAVTATHRTTEEFLHDLLDSSHASLARHRAVLSEFLNQCDLAKFAGVSLSTESMESLHQSARAFVLETAKPDDPPKAPAAAQSAIDLEAHDTLPST